MTVFFIDEANKNLGTGLVPPELLTSLYEKLSQRIELIIMRDNN